MVTMEFKKPFNFSKKKKKKLQTLLKFFARIHLRRVMFPMLARREISNGELESVSAFLNQEQIPPPLEAFERRGLNRYAWLPGPAFAAPGSKMLLLSGFERERAHACFHLSTPVNTATNKNPSQGCIRE